MGANGTLRTLALMIAYDGTDWAGIQRLNDRPTIGETLNTALTTVLRHPVCMVAAGRTDAGVHALGQMISLRTDNPLPLENLHRAVNRLLPASIRVRRVDEREERFHARCSAINRRYWYLLQTARQPDPLRGRFCWQLDRALDADKMQEALLPLLGQHDFRAYCHGEVHPPRGSVRTIQRLRIRRRRALLVIDVQADAFLHHMVRLLVANVVRVGIGERPVDWPAELLESRDRHGAGKGAPACGLFLMRIGYPPIHDCTSVREDTGEEYDEMLSGKAAGS